MEYRINDNLCQAKLSIIRRISDLTLANRKPGEKVVLFSSGQPADEAMPVELVKEYTTKIMDEYGCQVLQYGGHKGYPEIFPEIRKFLNKDGEVAKAEDDFIITYFTRGAKFQNLSIEIYSMTHRRISPKINALSALLFLAVLIIMILINIRERHEEKIKSSK